MKKVKFIIALYVGKILALLTKVISKKRGTNIPGAYANKIKKDFIKEFKGIDYEKVIFVTGTNGKSTTNNVIVHTLRNSGKKVITNIEGANLLGGIATTLIKNSTLTGKIKADFLCFEVDERSLPKIYEYLPAKNICITNLQKDQVQRNGEPDFIYQKLKKVINKNMRLFLNNEEPRVRSFGNLTEEVIYYGVEKNGASFEKNSFYDVTLPCPKCNDKIQFEYYNVENVGKFKCLNCGFESEENPKYCIKNIRYDEHKFECNGNEYEVPYKEPFYMYNYALCIAVCKTLGLTHEEIQQAFSNFKNYKGILEEMQYKNNSIKYMRIKQENPETLQSAIDYIARDKNKKIVMLGLGEVKDFMPYYTNTFYSFDCHLDKLIDSDVEKYICFSDAVAYDCANRLIYEGIDKDKITIVSTEDYEVVLKELDKYECNNVYLITLMRKYKDLVKVLDSLKGENKNE